MPYVSLSTIADAIRTQETFELPLLVFVHSESEATTEEASLNPPLSSVSQVRYGCCHLNKAFDLSVVKGRSSQLDAFKRIMSVARQDHMVLVHEVQEGTPAYQQLTAAVQCTEVPRVHVLPSKRSSLQPSILHGPQLTAGRLVLSIQTVSRVPYGGALPDASTPGIAALLRKVLDDSEGIRTAIVSMSASHRPPPPPPSSTRPASKPTLAKEPAAAPKAAAPPAPKAAAPPAPTHTPAPTPSTIPTTPAEKAAPQPSSSDDAPPTQKKKTEGSINIRCSLPQGKVVTVEGLSQGTNSVRDHVRPGVEREVGHGNFDFALCLPPKRLSREQEALPLQEIGITSSCALRIFLSQPAAAAPPAPSEARPATTGGVLNRVFSHFRPFSSDKGADVPRPPSAPYRGESRVRTLQDVLNATRDPQDEDEDSAERGGPSPSTLPPNERAQMERMMRLRSQNAQQEEEEEDAQRPFSGVGRRLKDGAS